MNWQLSGGLGWRFTSPSPRSTAKDSMRYAMRASIATVALALRASDAAPCPPGVTAAPPVVTVMASTENPESDAWIVKTDCSHTTKSISNTGALGFGYTNVDRIESIPTGTTSVGFGNAKLSRGGDFRGAPKLESVGCERFDPSFVDNLQLPSTLTKLGLNIASVESLDKLILPASLKTLYLQSLGIESLKGIPTGLTFLSVQALSSISVNSFTGINFPIPPKLETLEMAKNQVSTLERITFPESLKSFTCEDCIITSIRGIKWPRSLTNLNLLGNPIREFELRQSDYDFLNTLSGLNLDPTQGKCSNKEAAKKSLPGSNIGKGDPIVCVITDDQFEALYSSDPTSPSSTGSSDEDTDSASVSTGNSAGSDGNDDDTNGASQSNSSGNSTAGGGGVSSNDPTSGGGQKDQPGATPSSSSSSAATIIGILIAVSSVFGIVLAVLAWRRFRRSRQMKGKAGEATGDTLMPFDTPLYNHINSSNGGSSQEYLSNDIRNDKALIPYRIDQKEISLSKQIARGGFGVIFRGVYNGRAVAVKQMLPDAWRSETQLVSFMDEIRLCASLSHPKIVEFIGVAWTSLRDISVIIEYMGGGDLNSILHKHAHAQSLVSSTTSFASVAASLSPTSSFASSPHEWFERWTTAAINSKTLIARDIAEAVVYLHSFSNPILHRDLKARNVLLDTQGNAKLSDFGISREMAVDETMTSEVGTSAWIAPEVLRGDRYSERADMYSFGVLLVELDKCRHPYAGEETLMLMDGSSVQLASVPPKQQCQVQGTRSQAMHQNMQIAMLVSAGHLRPKPSETCPARVQALIARCLSFAPEDRLSAMEAHYELRQILVEQ